MKRLILFFAFASLLSSAAMGASGAATSDFKLQVHGDRVFNMVVDGQFYFNPTTQAHARNLLPGRHFIEITAAPRTNRHGVVCGKEVLFRGEIYLSPGTVTRARIDRHNNLVVKLVKPKKSERGCHSGCAAGCTMHNGGAVQGHSCSSTCSSDVHYSGGQPVLWSGTTGNACGTQAAMGEQAFGNFLNALSAASFENTKRQMALDALASHRFTSGQVALMLSRFSFEVTRLEIAIRAFSNTVDPGNYYLVDQQFSFHSSVRELHEAIYG